MQQQPALAELVRNRRRQAGISAAELARRAGTNKTTITRLEMGRIPKPETLQAIAKALDLPPRELLESAHYLDPDDLPSLTPYLRTRYGYLSDRARAEIAQSFRDITERYGYDPDHHGPAAGEDDT